MSDMGVTEWGAIGGVILALIALGVVVYALAGAAQAAARASKEALGTALARIDRLQTDLVEHRVASAREFVTHDVLAALEARLAADRQALEARILAAIDSLGKRIDQSLHGG